MHGNTSINPFFYGTYLAETKPNEPVTRTKLQAFQADAVGAAHQLTTSHFNTPHTFRLEWQPGPGGRIDWYAQGHKINSTFSIEGDGKGTDWTHAYGLKDESLKKLMGSQIPIEASYMIFNVAVSSTWGFPYDIPEWCPKCYDCDDPKCACSFYPGFCSMLRSNKTYMLIDSIRVYQSSNVSAHVGVNHSTGCDPPDYPTKEWITGHDYLYSRAPPFGNYDRGSLKRQQRGGGSCGTDSDCGGHINTPNLTAAYEDMTATGRRAQAAGDDSSERPGRGTCMLGAGMGMFGSSSPGYVCSCEEGFTGPHCLAQAFFDESPSAHKIRQMESPFHRISNFQVPFFMLTIVIAMITILLSLLVSNVMEQKRNRRSNSEATAKLQKPVFNATILGGDDINGNFSIITGTSI